jgi:cold shock CspA family protein
MNKKTGVCVRFGPNGYGFIADSETGKQYFVHVRSTVNCAALLPGDRVEFDAITGPKGLQAINVVVKP